MAGVRRTWNKDEAKAKKRAEMGGNEESDEKPTSTILKSTREEFVPAAEDAKKVEGSERAYLKAREHSLDLDSKIGKTQIVTTTDSDGGVSSGGALPGYFCEVCKCLLKDSVSYLDHINGKKHQRALGYSMRVERAGVDQVKDRLDSLKRKISNTRNNTTSSSSNDSNSFRSTAVQEYEAREVTLKLEEENRKKKKREELSLRKKEEELSEMDGGIDPEIANLMGFGSFGGNSRKN